LIFRCTAVLCAALVSQSALATSDALADLLSGENGAAGLGFAIRMEQSMYRGAGMRFDALPIYQYEGESFYLHTYRAGMKFNLAPDKRFDAFLAHRFEGFPSDRVPDSLAGMKNRGSEADFGLSYEQKFPWGRLFGEALHDISGLSMGNELRLGYSDDWRSGSLKISPMLMVSARDAHLNNYYYGVTPDEAAPGRPAYQPGSGFTGTVSLNARYDLTDRWRLLAGIYATRWGSTVRDSPIVENRIVQFGGFAGFAYDFTPSQSQFKPDRSPVVVKIFHGVSSPCNLLPIMEFRCTSTDTPDRTSVDSIEIGRPFIEQFNDWPVDFVGYVGALRHNENNLQPDFWQIDAYMKVFYYGFPWSGRVRTRIGFGMGLSYAQKVPFVEARDQEERGRPTSKLLNYLDPTIDVSIGDIFGSRRLHDTYFGFGVSHRSGIFGESQLLGNVDGGSNYIYTYIETRL
jgi:MipA family protein